MGLLECRQPLKAGGAGRSLACGHEVAERLAARFRVADLWTCLQAALAKSATVLEEAEVDDLGRALGGSAGPVLFEIASRRPKRLGVVEEESHPKVAEQAQDSA